MTSAGGILVILPSPTDGGEPIQPGVAVAGLPLLRRLVLAADRAGFRPVLVHPRLESGQCLAGTPGTMLPFRGPIPELSARRVVLLSMAIVPQPEWLRGLLQMPLEAEQFYVDGALTAVVEAENPWRVVAVVSRCRGMVEAREALGALFKTVERCLGGGGRFALETPEDVPAAERWLLRSLIKPNEGFMSRLLERRISLALTRRLCTTRVTPNAMTLVSIAVGLCGAPFFLSSRPVYQLAGALLFLAHSILDGCDGELARLKFQESRAGAVLDICGDNLVHAAVFACMAVGWSLHVHPAWPLLLGGITVLSTLWVAVVVHGRGMRATVARDETGGRSRLVDMLVYRDFIYLIVLLAAAGKAPWFLVLTAIGAPAFLLLLAWLGRAPR